MPTYQVIVTVEVPDVEASDTDDAINYVTEQIESVFDRPVSFSKETATNYSAQEE